METGYERIKSDSKMKIIRVGFSNKTMASSSSWIYASAELPEAFPDVIPVDVTEEEHNGVACIDYTDDYRLSFGYLRAVLQTCECSPRVLKLTATCLQQNPANYTVWHYRRQCLEAVHSGTDDALKSYIQADLELAASLGGDNPKNYQVWYHRRALLERLLDVPELFADYALGELDYIRQVLLTDGKNIHAWSHRQWVVARRNDNAVWESEFNLTSKLLQQDGRNNSAWNHRWFVTHRGALSTLLSAETARLEMDHAIEAASSDPYNESSWVYFVAVLKEQVYSLQDASQVIALLTSSKQKVESVQTNLLPDASNGVIQSRYLLAAMVDILEWMGSIDALNEAGNIAMTLAEQHDTIRRAYWRFRMDSIQDIVSTM
jgi:protein farnesyltransferase/geranylgeranyltransferase type-1 subunit alpha